MTMKTIKSFLAVISIAIMGLMAGSCDKTPINGDLDGMWQLMRVEDNGTTIDVAATQHYMCVQLHLIQLTQYGDVHTGIFCHFNHEGNTLRLYDFYDRTHYVDNQIAEEKMTDADKLSPWGIYLLDTTFQVNKLTSDALILQDPAGRVLTFRKF